MYEYVYRVAEYVYGAEPNASGQPRGPQARVGCTDGMDSSRDTPRIVADASRPGHDVRHKEERRCPQPSSPVDVAKSVFEVAVSTRLGRVGERHRLTRPQFARFVATRPAATVLMEACGCAHLWGRHAQAHGHRVVLLPPPTSSSP